MKRKILSCVLISILVGVLGITNPGLPTFESFVLQGMGEDELGQKNFKSIFSNIGVVNIATRDNYVLFSIFEISPSFIASMEVSPDVFTFDTSALRVRFLGIGSSFYAFPGTDNGIKFLMGYFELCRTGAIDCRYFIRKYGL